MQRTVIPIVSMEIPKDFQFDDLKIAMVKVMQHLHSLEGELNTAYHSVVSEIYIPYGFVWGELIHKEFGCLVSGHPIFAIHIRAVHNFGEILIGQTVISNEKGDSVILEEPLLPAVEKLSALHSSEEMTAHHQEVIAERKIPRSVEGSMTFPLSKEDAETLLKEIFIPVGWFKVDAGVIDKKDWAWDTGKRCYVPVHPDLVGELAETAYSIIRRINPLETAPIPSKCSISEVHSSLTFDEVSKVNFERANLWHGEGGMYEWDYAMWAMATAGEFGELCNVLKKLRRFDDGIKGNEISDNPLADSDLYDEIKKELGGTYIYLDLLAQHLNINLGDAVRMEFNRVSERAGFPQKL